ncbi:MAG: hypothetical protein PQJ58_10755 [Spirochaetales bacterium]|nr:hypothetical protein [Spirochaetales bacterium]
MKKTILILLMVLMASSVFAYTNASFGIGADIYFNSENDEFGDTKDSYSNIKIIGSIMLDTVEVAPYFKFSTTKQYDTGNLVDKYGEWGFGSLFHIPVLTTEVITLGPGLDVGVGFGTFDDEFYTDISAFSFYTTFPLIMDVSLGAFVFRISQNIGGFHHDSFKAGTLKYTESTFYFENGFGPRFGFLYTF